MFNVSPWTQSCVITLLQDYMLYFGNTWGTCSFLSRMLVLSLCLSLPEALWFSTLQDFLQRVSYSCWRQRDLFACTTFPSCLSLCIPLSCYVICRGSVPVTDLLYNYSNTNVLLHFQMVDPDLLTWQLLHTVQQRNGELNLFFFFWCSHKLTREVQTEYLHP